MSIILSQKATAFNSDLETPVALFMRLVGENQGIFLESAEVDGKWGRSSIIATDFLLTAICKNGVLELEIGDSRLESLSCHSGKPFMQGVRELMRDITITNTKEFPPITRALYGYFGYGVVGMIEPKLASVVPPKDAEAALALPNTIIYFDHCYNKVHRITLEVDGKPLKSIKSSFKLETAQPLRDNALTGKEAFINSVKRTTEQIRQGEGIQVVVSSTFSAPLSESPFAIYRRLRYANPSPYMFYMRFPTGVLLGSSPEVMSSCTENKLRLCPIAGTRPRSSDPKKDAQLAEELLLDPKERAEHVMLVDLGRNDLGRIATAGSVTVERFMEVEKFSHVMHLTSYIFADIKPGLEPLDVFEATFPAGTLSGAPKVRAMEIIAEEEQAPRGPYGGALGWIGLDKDSINLDFGIIIRSLWIRDGLIRWQAGAGIVYDSDPEKEWVEALNKSAVIRKVVLDESN